MGLKGTITTSDYLEWEKMQYLYRKLEKQGKYNYALLINIGSYTGLRIGDILELKWSDFVGRDELVIIEQKTKKRRVIHIHDDSQELINRVITKTQPVLDDYIFMNYDSGKTYTIQHFNRKLKLIAKEFKLKMKFSCHSLRKTMSRRVWSQNNESEASLILLSEMLSHRDISTTRKYLGIRSEEIQGVYINL